MLIVLSLSVCLCLSLSVCLPLTHTHAPSQMQSFFAISEYLVLTSSWKNEYSLMQIIIEMNPKSLSFLAFHKNSETQSRGLHRPLHSLPIFSLTGSGLSQLHLVLVECAYQSYSREMRPNSLVPWWLRRLVQACDMSSTSGLTWDFKFLSSGNFHQI